MSPRFMLGVLIQTDTRKNQESRQLDLGATYLNNRYIYILYIRFGRLIISGT